MKEVDLHIDVAQDGSGYTLSQNTSTRTAYIYSERNYGYTLIVPLTDEEEANHSQNIIEHNGVSGLKAPRVNEQYFD